MERYIFKKNILKITFEHPGVKAPGTANTTIFLPVAIFARFTFFVGESSKRSIAGSLSPT